MANRLINEAISASDLIISFEGFRITRAKKI